MNNDVNKPILRGVLIAVTLAWALSFGGCVIHDHDDHHDDHDHYDHQDHPDDQHDDHHDDQH
jgi:hypothetical protein